MFLEMPKSLVCPVAYLINQVPNWQDFESIYINSSVYDGIKENSLFKLDDNMWLKKENKAQGEYSPSLSYRLRQISFDLWIVEWIEYNGIRKYFTSKPIGSVYISYEHAA